MSLEKKQTMKITNMLLVILSATLFIIWE